MKQHDITEKMDAMDILSVVLSHFSTHLDINTSQNPDAPEDNKLPRDILKHPSTLPKKT